MIDWREGTGLKAAGCLEASTMVGAEHGTVLEKRSMVPMSEVSGGQMMLWSWVVRLGG
jgi:hypothetical protein